jgi:hypothetical protein
MFVGNRRTRFRADQILQMVLTSMMLDHVNTLYYAKLMLDLLSVSPS